MTAKGCWLSAETNLGEKKSPRDITHKMVGNRVQKGKGGNQDK